MHLKALSFYIKLLVEIDVHRPLEPGFSFQREGGEPIRVTLIYERLGDYCISC